MLAQSDGDILTTEPDGHSTNEHVRCVLVVDDSRVQRKILSTSLKKWGYDVLEAESGSVALEICRRARPDLILSDWMMPGMTGIELCEEYRRLESDAYGYFILLTSKNEKNDIALGLQMGADDFLTKPVNPAELRARISAGERILTMQQTLTQQNQQLNETLTELQTVYRALDRDLDEARRLQQSLVPERYLQFSGADVSLLLRPSGHVGGDLVGVFEVSPSRIGLYAIDVAGHGIASALMTARLAGYLSGSSPDRNLALTTDDAGNLTMRSPGQICELLNTLISEDPQVEHYFTMLVADCDLRTGGVSMVQAGHPSPLILRSNGDIEFLGEGGMPIGLIPNAHFEELEFQLKCGDRILLYSDGITECANKSGEMLDDAGLSGLVKKNAGFAGAEFLEAIIWDLTEFADGSEFADDVSAVLLQKC